MQRVLRVILNSMHHSHLTSCVICHLTYQSLFLGVFSSSVLFTPAFSSQCFFHLPLSSLSLFSSSPHRSLFFRCRSFSRLSCLQVKHWPLPLELRRNPSLNQCLTCLLTLVSLSLSARVLSLSLVLSFFHSLGVLRFSFFRSFIFSIALFPHRRRLLLLVSLLSAQQHEHERQQQQRQQLLSLCKHIDIWVNEIMRH